MGTTFASLNIYIVDGGKGSQYLLDVLFKTTQNKNGGKS